MNITSAQAENQIENLDRMLDFTLVTNPALHSKFIQIPQSAWHARFEAVMGLLVILFVFVGLPAVFFFFGFQAVFMTIAVSITIAMVVGLCVNGYGG